MQTKQLTKGPGGQTAVVKTDSYAEDSFTFIEKTPDTSLWPIYF